MAVISSSWYCHYQSLSHSPPQQNFRQLFFSFQEVQGYPTSLISWFINFKGYGYDKVSATELIERAVEDEAGKSCYMSVRTYLQKFYTVIFLLLTVFMLIENFNAAVLETPMTSFCETYNLKSIIKQATCFKNPEKQQ